MKTLIAFNIFLLEIPLVIAVFNGVEYIKNLKPQMNADKSVPPGD